MELTAVSTFPEMPGRSGAHSGLRLSNFFPIHDQETFLMLSSRPFYAIERGFSRRAMEPDPPPPSLPWRFGSAAVMGFIGTVSRVFIYGANSQETHGLDGFLELIDERADIDNRNRGLLTGEWALLLLWVSSDITLCIIVSNHISVYVRITI